MNITVIIPSLNPDERLPMVVEGMIAAGFLDIIVVDDGSDEAHQGPFVQVAAWKECTVLTHPVNKGKGRALKTAFQYVLEHRGDVAGVVTVDGDNQHKPQDVADCVRELERYPDDMILGVRNFDEEQVPFKSRFGNKCTSFVFRFACGLNISDTQTGLRVIPMKHLQKMTEIEGERFEYETNMLLELKKSKIGYRQVPIETVYINENESTHFHPIRDSFKIYGIIFRYLFGSAASAGLDLLAFALLNLILTPVGMKMKLRVFVATALARLISSLFNYVYNRKAVFGSTGNKRKTMVRYYILCVCQMMVSYGLVYALTSFLTAGNILMVIIKAVVDTILFLVSFQIQRLWVFEE